MIASTYTNSNLHDVEFHFVLEIQNGDKKKCNMHVRACKIMGSVQNVQNNCYCFLFCFSHQVLFSAASSFLEFERNSGNRRVPPAL